MTKQSDIIDILKSIPIFLDLKPFQLIRLATAASVEDLDPGVELITEGNPLDYTYILLEGEMIVQSFVPTYGNVETSRLGPLDVCGWSALTPIVRQRTGTVITNSYCRVLKLDSRLLIPICDEDHDIGYCIYKRISNVVARTFLTTRLQLLNILLNEIRTPVENIKP